MPGIFLGDEDKMINTIDNVLPLTWCLHSCEGTYRVGRRNTGNTNQIIPDDARALEKTRRVMYQRVASELSLESRGCVSHGKPGKNCSRQQA